LFFNLKAPVYPETKNIWRKIRKFDIRDASKLQYNSGEKSEFSLIEYIMDEKIYDFTENLGLTEKKILEVANSIDRSAMRNIVVCPTESNYIAVEQKKDINNIIPVEKQARQYIYLSANKIKFDQLSMLWDSISLTTKEDLVVDAIKILEKNILKIDFPSHKSYSPIRIKVKNARDPIPLSNMGEGMYRILAMAMSLVTSENGVLLVDEIETGLHYEAQTDMWRLILETAKELNVQVFATTHSWDCIAAYQEALSQVEDKSIGKLFRLDSKYGKLRAVEYDADDLDIAVRKGIEVR